MRRRRPNPFKPPHFEKPKWTRWLAAYVMLAVAALVGGVWWAIAWNNPVAASQPKHKVVLVLADDDNSSSTTTNAPAAPGTAAKPAATSSNVTALALAAFQPGPYRQGELVVRANSAAELQQLIARARAAGASVLDQIPSLNAVRLQFDNPAEIGTFMAGNPGDPPVQADLNYLVHLPTPPPPYNPAAPSSLLPFGNGALAYVGVPPNNSQWGTGVSVAMLDTGLSPGVRNWLRTPIVQEMDYVDDGSAAPGHGDLVAGLLAGTVGLIGAGGQQGLVPDASLISVRVLDNNDTGDVFSVAAGLAAALDRGAQVVNMSMATNEDTPILQSAIQQALDAGVVLVAAAGNDNGAISYPAAYPGVVAVGAVDASGQRAAFSNYGPQMSLAAPGVGITEQTPSGMQTISGTSASAPIVAGAVASLMASNPGMTGQQAVALLEQYADYEGPVTTTGTNDYYGSGVLDLARVNARNNPSRTDFAFADIYLDLTNVNLSADPSTLSGLQVPLQIVMQNRGNSVLQPMQVNLAIGSKISTQIVSGLKANEVRAITVNVPLDQLFTGLTVSATTPSAPISDATLLNNTISRKFLLSNPATSNSASLQQPIQVVSH